jgi:hypothetical protein
MGRRHPAVVWALWESWVDQFVIIRRGQLWAADDPIVRRNPDAFTDDPTLIEGLIKSSLNPSGSYDPVDFDGIAEDAEAKLAQGLRRGPRGA